MTYRVNDSILLGAESLAHCLLCLHVDFPDVRIETIEVVSDVNGRDEWRLLVDLTALPGQWLTEGPA